MAVVSRISDKRVLVIDDMEGMRSQLRMALSSSGFEKLHVVASIRDALARMEENRYDIILCDYSLGDSTDGQQFLEYLRTRDLISRNTIFVMITAEQAYEKVVAASECAPDDYLLKPFTAAQFNARLEKLLDRQEYFLAIDKAIDAKDWKKVVVECDRLMAAKDKYFVELCKIKGAAMMHDNRAKEAAELYRQIIALRPVGWAKLGLARALAADGQRTEAIEQARQILAEHPQFMAVYDFLSRQEALSGQSAAAMETLIKAREIAPGTMSRIRELSGLAVNNGRPDLAEGVMRETLKKHRFSPVREAHDYATLSRALVQQGKSDEALKVVSEARESFKDTHSAVVLAATESVAHHASGNHERAHALIEQVLAADPSSLPPDVLASVADACFAHGKEEDATRLLRHVVQNNPEDKAAHERVHRVLTAAGKGAEEASALIDDSTREVIRINNDGVRKAEAGQINDAVELLCEAANRLPNNMQIVSNAAMVLALDLVRNGKSPETLGKCMRYRAVLLDKAPNHPKLPHIDALLKQVKS